MLKWATFLFTMPSAGGKSGSNIFITRSWIHFFTVIPQHPHINPLECLLKTQLPSLYEIPTDIVISLQLELCIFNKFPQQVSGESLVWLVISTPDFQSTITLWKTLERYYYTGFIDEYWGSRQSIAPRNMQKSSRATNIVLFLEVLCPSRKE